MVGASQIQLGRLLTIVLATTLTPLGAASGQALGQPDRDQPGDQQIQAYLQDVTTQLESGLSDDLKSREEFARRRPQYLDEYYYMLGLSPLPERTPLQATVTGQVAGRGYVVELLHYQSRPGLYVTANLYRPARQQAGERLPAVLYVCGHSGRGRDGNKTAFQSHGIWFARHGYVCLIVDTLQLGEIAAIHHGTYREQRWWWQSRGYTPAGVECWNGIRGIDYLISRPDVDPERIAVTGISGGGAATFWIAAADDRVRAAIPISGMADLASYVPNRVINGHCDCMFLINTFHWPWTRIAALVAPRPLLFINSDQDSIFPMDANERISNRLERFYALEGAGDRFETLVSIGGHDYRRDIRQASYRFLNSWLKNDPRTVDDSEEDLVVESRPTPQHPISPEQLRVFKTDADLPRDELNSRIDEHFVPLAAVAPPEVGQFETWRKQLVGELQRVTLPDLKAAVGQLTKLDSSTPAQWHLKSEDGLMFVLRPPQGPLPAKPRRVVLIVRYDDDPPDGTGLATASDLVWICEPRGVGTTRWTRRNPPNYVERSLALLGDTVAAGQVRDVRDAVAFVRDIQRKQDDRPPALYLAGRGPAGLVAAYAALEMEDVAGVDLIEPPLSHMEPAAPALLNILRVADVPQLLGLLAPRRLTIYTRRPAAFDAVKTIYHRAEAADRVDIMR